MPPSTPRPRARRLTTAVLAVVAISVPVACSADGSTRAEPVASAPASTGPAVSPATVPPATATTAPASGATTATAPPTTQAVVPAGFRAVLATVVGPDGEERELCLLLAATPDERAQGLMGVTSLGGYDGMAFVWDEPSDGAFWMKDTLIPLSIAFFGADGTFVSSTDMVPCAPGSDCPTYGAGGEYTAAVEVPAGGLPARGLVDGASLRVSDEDCVRSPAGA